MLANPVYVAPSERLSTSFRRYGPGVLCALCGFLSAFTIAIGGLMPVGELILLAALPWVLIRTYFRHGWPGRIQQLGWYQLLMVLAGFTALGYVVSDLYRATEFENLVRGWARVGFLVIDLIAVSYLIDRSWNRLVVFVLALYIGTTVAATLTGPLYGEWWKFGFGYTTTALVLFACAGRGVATQVIVAALLGGLNLFLGARSLGGICLLTGALFGLHHARGLWRPFALLGALGATVSLLFAANAAVIENHSHAGSNIERQSMIEAALELFVTSPFVGQGSWFTATEAIARLEEKRVAIDSSFRGYDAEEARKLSIHSQLLVSLAEGGLLGGAFFLGLGILVLKTLRTLTRHSVPHRAFIFYLVLSGGWNLLMSPFSGVARVEIALLACTCLLVILQRLGEGPEEYRE